MKKTSSKKILIIEDHPLISNSYKVALETLEKQATNLKFDITIATNCDEALLNIHEASSSSGVDLIFLDISIPASKDKLILSGEDLGVHIKKLLPKAKIIISTMYSHNYRVYSIIQNLDPDGFLIKGDVNHKLLIEAIKSVLKNQTYYSQSVVNLGRKIISKPYSVDQIDRKLLYEISKGAKMCELTSKIPLSKGGLERRKRNLKDIFGMNSHCTDRELIEKAEAAGFI